MLQLPQSGDDDARFVLILDQADDLIAANKQLDYDPLDALTSRRTPCPHSLTACTPS
ncbi:hypothetical protein [Streptomyces sp. NPDC057910]|uniref:hypothetical protein n=1 Tax=Streptomyces sp. NPDC057910 TaxID=3346278 RepID=UPI0036E96478